MITVRTRDTSDWRWTAAVYLGAATVSVLVAIVLITLSGNPVQASLAALGQGATGSVGAISSSMVKATPIVLTGLATCLAYRSGLWTVGQEAQVLLGAAAAWQTSLWLTGLEPVIVILGCFAAALTAGAMHGALVGVMRVRLSVSEIVSSVMLNYVAFFFLVWLIAGPWQQQGGTASYQQTERLDGAYWLPYIVDAGRLHVGALLVVGVLIWLQITLTRTSLGYEMRAMRPNPVALSQRGVSLPGLTYKVLVISGAIAAIAGMVEVFGVSHRITGNNLIGIGFEGIIVALIGRLTPVGTLLAGLFFGALHNGALFMNVMTGVPTALVTALQGSVLILFLVAGVLAARQISWRR